MPHKFRRSNSRKYRRYKRKERMRRERRLAWWQSLSFREQKKYGKPIHPDGRLKKHYSIKF